MILNTNLGGMGNEEYEDGGSQYGSEEVDDEGNYMMADNEDDYEGGDLDNN